MSFVPRPQSAELTAPVACSALFSSPHGRSRGAASGGYVPPGAQPHGNKQTPTPFVSLLLLMRLSANCYRGSFWMCCLTSHRHQFACRCQRWNSYGAGRPCTPTWPRPQCPGVQQTHQLFIAPAVRKHYFERTVRTEAVTCNKACLYPDLSFHQGACPPPAVTFALAADVSCISRNNSAVPIR